MFIEIRKLTSDLLDDYLYFFENIAHADNKDWNRCYCVGYCSDANSGKDFSSPEVRKEYAIRYIRDGKIQGYLAYCDNQVVGWCNANCKSDCLKCESWQLISKNYESTDLDSKTKSVFCFTVAPNMRRKGIATQLLERVCKDAFNDGFDFIEAYPNKGYTNMFYDYVGPLGLYQKLGFTISGETEERYIVQKQLKQLS